MYLFIPDTVLFVANNNAKGNKKYICSYKIYFNFLYKKICNKYLYIS